MMAHEVPIAVHQKASTPVKTRKHKPVHQPKSLPNGEKPNFNSGHKDKSKNGRAPQLPNGEKPDFGGFEHKKEQGIKPSGGKKSKRSTTKKEGATTPTLTNPPALGNGDDKECYAGSSFHSSPEALALPKPSFAGKFSEKSVPKTPNLQAVPSPNMPPRNIQSMPPAFVYQGMPSNGPPRFPVTAYSPSPLPGFDYNANRQGFINYSYPPSAVPQPPLPMQSYPFQAYPPVPPPSNRQYGGQKITFNQLMGSSR